MSLSRHERDIMESFGTFALVLDMRDRRLFELARRAIGLRSDWSQVRLDVMVNLGHEDKRKRGKVGRGGSRSKGA